MGGFCQVDHDYECSVAVKAGHSDVCVPWAYSLRRQGTGIENLPGRTQKHREHHLITGKYRVVPWYVCV